MKRVTFLEGVVVALSLGLGGAVARGALAWVVPAGPALRLVIAAAGLAYVVYLLDRSAARTGRVTLLAVWAIAAAIAWSAAPSLALYVLVHAGLVWLVRAIRFHAGLAGAAADLGLTALGLAAGAWAASATHGVFATLWCFFLVQALFVAIPAGIARATPRPSGTDDGFEHAHGAAQAALRRLSLHRYSQGEP